MTNQELMARRQAIMPRGVGQAHAVFVDHAKNAEVWDVEGRRYIDFAGGIAVLNTGHLNDKVIGAVKAQLERYTHTCFQVIAYEPLVELAERLCKLAPGATPKKAMFLTTGAEAVENAIKIARAATKRSGVIAFGGGFHGRTMMGMALTGKVVPYKVGFGPFPGEIFHAPFPHPLHGVSVEDSLHAIEHIFKYDIEPSRVAAMIIEPVQGEGGFTVAPKEFMMALRKMCDQHGILLIADEIQTGAGRTGTFFASEQMGIEPDMITLAKSMAGGFPISALIGKAAIMDAPEPGGLGGTYAGSPLGAVAALAVLDVFAEDKLLDRSKAVGERLTASLNRLKAEYKCIAEVRGLGAMVAFEVFNAEGKPDGDTVKKLVALAAQKGLILLSCGSYGNVVRILVPLTASDALLDEGMAIISNCMKELGC